MALTELILFDLTEISKVYDIGLLRYRGETVTLCVKNSFPLLNVIINSKKN